MHNPKLTRARQTQIAITAAASALTLAAGSYRALGLGITLPDQDAFATARGNAFVATADDPAAVYYNPAGLSQLSGMNFSLGAYGILYSDRFKGPPGSVNAKTQWAAIPQVFSSVSFTNYHLTLGFGTYSPYGLRMNWPDKSPFPERTGQISYGTAAPMLAWEIFKGFSVAAGPTLNYSDAELKFLIPGGIADEFHGNATSAGYTLGVMYKLTEQHSFGVTYHSATEMNYNGHGNVPFPSTPVSADFHFPQSVDFGYSFRPTAKWNFEADANWTDWSTLQTVEVKPYGPALPFDWKPSWMVDLGATRYLGDGWRVSGGWMYSMNSSPSGTFNPLVADSDRYLFSVGVGKRWDRYSIDAAYQFGWGPSRSIAGDGSADGSYEFISNALTINFGLHF